MNKIPVKEMISWLLSWAETIDPEDMIRLDAWLYTSYLALEPFPSYHCRYRERCLDSFDLPVKRLRTARSILRSASKEADEQLEICARQVSPYYSMILTIFLQHNSKEIQTGLSSAR